MLGKTRSGWRTLKLAVPILAFVASLLVVLVWTGRWQPFVRQSDEPTAAGTAAAIEAQFVADIRGQDADDDGIRDDVGRWVRERFADDPRRQQGFLQLAAAYQGVLVTTGDVQASRGNLITLSQSLACVRYLAGDEAEALITQLKAVILNSDIRVRAWLKAYDRWEESGMSGMSQPSAAPCRFPVD